MRLLKRSFGVKKCRSFEGSEHQKLRTLEFAWRKTRQFSTRKVTQQISGGSLRKWQKSNMIRSKCWYLTNMEECGTKINPLWWWRILLPGWTKPLWFPNPKLSLLYSKCELQCHSSQGICVFCGHKRSKSHFFKAQKLRSHGSFVCHFGHHVFHLSPMGKRRSRMVAYGKEKT